MAPQNLKNRCLEGVWEVLEAKKLSKAVLADFWLILAGLGTTKMSP